MNLCTFVHMFVTCLAGMGLFQYLSLPNKPHTNLIALKTSVFGHRSAIWSGFEGDSLSVLHSAPAGMAQRIGVESSEGHVPCMPSA